MSELAKKIRALNHSGEQPLGNTFDAGYALALEHAAALAEAQPDPDARSGRLSNDERLEYQEALIWCSGSLDFAPEGQAREGWIKLCKPLIERQPIEGASCDNWCSWLDDLPLPEGFEDGIAALQEFIAGLPRPDPDALVAAAYEAAAQRATGFFVGDPANGIPLRNPLPHEIAKDIRAMTPADAIAERDRRDKQMRAEGRRAGMQEATEIAQRFMDQTEDDYEAAAALDIKFGILAAAEKGG